MARLTAADFSVCATAPDGSISTCESPTVVVLRNSAFTLTVSNATRPTPAHFEGGLLAGAARPANLLHLGVYAAQTGSVAIGSRGLYVGLQPSLPLLPASSVWSPSTSDGVPLPSPTATAGNDSVLNISLPLRGSVQRGATTFFALADAAGNSFANAADAVLTWYSWLRVGDDVGSSIISVAALEDGIIMLHLPPAAFVEAMAAGETLRTLSQCPPTASYSPWQSVAVIWDVTLRASWREDPGNFTIDSSRRLVLTLDEQLDVAVLRGPLLCSDRCVAGGSCVCTAMLADAAAAALLAANASQWPCHISTTRYDDAAGAAMSLNDSSPCVATVAPSADGFALQVRFSPAEAGSLVLRIWHPDLGVVALPSCVLVEASNSSRPTALSAVEATCGALAGSAAASSLNNSSVNVTLRFMSLFAPALESSAAAVTTAATLAQEGAAYWTARSVGNDGTLWQVLVACNLVATPQGNAVLPPTLWMWPPAPENGSTQLPMGASLTLSAAPGETDSLLDVFALSPADAAATDAMDCILAAIAVATPTTDVTSADLARACTAIESWWQRRPAALAHSPSTALAVVFERDIASAPAQWRSVRVALASQGLPCTTATVWLSAAASFDFAHAAVAVAETCPATDTSGVPVATSQALCSDCVSLVPTPMMPLDAVPAFSSSTSVRVLASAVVHFGDATAWRPNGSTSGPQVLVFNASASRAWLARMRDGRLAATVEARGWCSIDLASRHWGAAAASDTLRSAAQAAVTEALAIASMPSPPASATSDMEWQFALLAPCVSITSATAARLRLRASNDTIAPGHAIFALEASANLDAAVLGNVSVIVPSGAQVAFVVRATLSPPRATSAADVPAGWRPPMHCSVGGGAVGEPACAAAVDAPSLPTPTAGGSSASEFACPPWLPAQCNAVVCAARAELCAAVADSGAACPATRRYRCWHGACQASAAACGAEPVCDASHPVRCATIGILPGRDVGEIVGLRLWPACVQHAAECGADSLAAIVAADQRVGDPWSDGALLSSQRVLCAAASTLPCLPGTALEAACVPVAMWPQRCGEPQRCTGEHDAPCLGGGACVAVRPDVAAVTYFSHVLAGAGDESNRNTTISRSTAAGASVVGPPWAALADDCHRLQLTAHALCPWRPRGWLRDTPFLFSDARLTATATPYLVLLPSAADVPHRLSQVAIACALDDDSCSRAWRTAQAVVPAPEAGITTSAPADASVLSDLASPWPARRCDPGAAVSPGSLTNVTVTDDDGDCVTVTLGRIPIVTSRAAALLGTIRAAAQDAALATAYGVWAGLATANVSGEAGTTVAALDTRDAGLSARLPPCPATAPFMCDDGRCTSSSRCRARHCLGASAPV